jgi:hypothetical protein
VHFSVSLVSRCHGDRHKFLAYRRECAQVMAPGYESRTALKENPHQSQKSATPFAIWDASYKERTYVEASFSCTSLAA